MAQHDKKDELDTYLTSVAKMIQDQEGDETFDKYLRMGVKHFRNYSAANTFLIMWQMPTATCVNAATRWHDIGWRVKPEQLQLPIRIRVPKTFNKTIQGDDGENDKQVKVTYFPLHGKIYDISQCEHDSEFVGERFDPSFSFKVDVGEEAKPLLDKLMVVAANNGYPISFENLQFGTLGYAAKGLFDESRRIVIDNKYPNGVQASVAIHEIAHQQLHLCQWGQSDLAKELREGEAEAVACLVMYNFGFDVGSNSAAYIRNHGCGHKAVIRSMGRILECAKWIISELEKLDE